MVKALDTQQFRDKIDPIRDAFKKLYDTRMPILANYEDFAKTQLDTLIGETVPMARESYRQAANYTAETSDFLKSAQEFDTPERRQEARGKAIADVTSASETARSNAIGQLESYGIDPSQTRSAAMDQSIRVQSALEAVRAAKTAEGDVEDKGRQYTAQALGLKGQATSQQNSAGATSANILNNNTSAANNFETTQANVMGTPQSLLTSRLGAIQDTASLKQAEQASKLASKQGESAGWAGIGQFVGMAGGAALGAYAGPAGALAGTQLGGQLGGAATGQAARAGY
jgi:hypothetical protein